MLKEKELKTLVEELYNTYDVLNEKEYIKTDDFCDDEETMKYINESRSKDLDIYYDFEENVIDKVMDKVGVKSYQVTNIITDFPNTYIVVYLNVEGGLMIVSFDSLEDVLDLRYKLTDVEDL